MKNKLSDLNDHLFAQLERLSDEEISEDALKKETIRGKAISALAANIINSTKLKLDAIKLIAGGKVRKEDIPLMITDKEK